jgi:hypothetical protein
MLTWFAALNPPEPGWKSLVFCLCKGIIVLTSSNYEYSMLRRGGGGPANTCSAHRD